MANWTAAFQLTPDGTDQVSEGDDRIRELKSEIRNELKVEHDCGTATVDADYLDTGRHKTGSARAFFHDLANIPTDLLKHTNAGSWPPVSPGNDEDDIAAVASSDLDNGRLWVNWDDGQPYVREQQQSDWGGGLAWSPANVDAGTSAAAWVSLYPRQWSVMATATNDDQPAAGADTREPIDGPYNAGGAPFDVTLGVEIAVPDDGKSYEILVEATCTYGESSNNGRDWGFYLVEDPTGASTILDQRIARIRSYPDVDQLTLRHLETAPTNGSTYVYIVEFECEVAAAAAVVNPTSAICGYAAGAATSRSNIIAHIRPRYLSATYTA